jgi:hypothetical protein
VLDAAAIALALPLPKPEVISEPRFLGIMASPEGFVVAELQQVLGSDKAIFLRFSSQDGEWVKQRVPYPLPCRRPLRADGAHSCSGRLWWVDLSWCLITCNPFADTPVLSAVYLPEGKALKTREASGVLDRYRCVGVSAGKVWFVDMYRNRNSYGAVQISVWALADRPGESSWAWTLEYEASFVEICDDPTYKATGLACPGRSPCSRSSIPPTPMSSTSSRTATWSASTCVLARSWTAMSTSWSSLRSNKLPPASFTLGCCHRLYAQVLLLNSNPLAGY